MAESSKLVLHGFFSGSLAPKVPLKASPRLGKNHVGFHVQMSCGKRNRVFFPQDIRAPGPTATSLEPFTPGTETITGPDIIPGELMRGLALRLNKNLFFYRLLVFDSNF